VQTTVVVFTGSYPFSDLAEDTFLKHEVRALAEVFDSVYIVPLRAVGTCSQLPKAVIVDTSLSRMRESVWRRSGAAVAACFSRGVFQAVTHKDLPPLNLRASLRMLNSMSDAMLVREWLHRFASADDTNKRRCLAYTYWCSGTTLGCLLARQVGDAIKVATRAHGADLYPWRHSPPFLPFQSAIATQVDRVFPISADGARYLSANFRIPPAAIEVARLGVPDPGGIAELSCNGVWRLVSCSYLVPIKRVGLIAEVVGRAALLAPEMRIEWQHIGGGPGEEELLKTVTRVLPPNGRFIYRGSIGSEEVVPTYLERPTDLFVNLSESEGIPVAAMEAISVGVPILALDVGGMREIVSEQNGRLLPASLGPDEIARSLLALLTDRDGLKRRGAAARSIWTEQYTAGTNFRVFARRMVELLKEE
jgi:Glycosyl transferases group 1